MSLAQKAIDSVNAPVFIQPICDVVYDCSINIIRESIRAGRPCIISLGETRVAVIGENDTGLFIHGDHGPKYLSDSRVANQYTGLAMILKDEPGPAPVKENIVIRTPESDEMDETLRIAVDQNMPLIYLCTKAGESWLPDHPVILTFKSPGEKQKAEKIRGMTVGPQIVIFDHVDIPSVFYHELGHVYYNCRLNDAEKEEVEALFKSMDGKFPPIFFSEWWHKTAEEMFASIYMWQLKGLALEPGYCKILARYFPRGLALLQKIQGRIHDEMSREQIFQERHRDLASALKLPTPIRTGQGLHKAILPMASTAPIPVPKSLMYDELATYEGRSWCEIRSPGLFQGSVVVMKNGLIDIPFMKAVVNPHLVPRQLQVKSKKGKVFTRTYMVNPFEKEPGDKRAGHLEKYERGIEALKKHGKSKEEIRTVIKEMGLSDKATARLYLTLDNKFPVDVETGPQAGAEPIPKAMKKAVLKKIRDNQGEYPEAKQSSTNVRSVPLDKVKPEEGGQIRKLFERQALLETAQSIHEQGLLQPILVRPDKNEPGLYRIIAGERRWRAMNILHEQGRLPEPVIDVIIKTKDGKPISDAEKNIMQLTENFVRKDNTPLETAAMLQTILEQTQDNGTTLTVKELVRKIGSDSNQLSEDKVRAYLRLNKLDPELKKLLNAGEISKTLAQVLGSIDEHNKQVHVFSMAQRKGWGVRQVQNYLKDQREQSSFFSHDETISEKQKRAEAELGKEGHAGKSGQLNQKLQSFINKQVDFVKKFMDKDEVDLSTLGAIVAGDADHGIARLEDVMRHLQTVVNRMKIKNQQLNTPGLFKAIREWPKRRLMSKAWDGLMSEWQEIQEEIQGDFYG